MQLIGVTQKPNSLTDTLDFNRAVLATHTAVGKTEVDETHRNLLYTLCRCQKLYVLADPGSVHEDTGLPLTITTMTEMTKKSLYVFTSLAYCRRFSVKEDIKPLFLEIPRNTEEGTFISLFQIALLKGITHIMINPGFLEAELMTEEIIKFGNLGYQVSQSMTRQELEEMLEKGKINPEFNRAKVARADSDPLQYLYHTTWKLDYLSIQYMANTLLSSMSFFTIRKKAINGEESILAAGDKEMKGRSVFDVLKEECGVVIIRGYCENVDAVIQAEFYNQTNRICLMVFEENPEHYAPYYKLDENRYSLFMDSIEINGFQGSAIQRSLELYKRHVQYQLGEKLPEQDRMLEKNGIFQCYNFNPDIHIPGKEKTVCPVCHGSFFVDLSNTRNGETYGCRCPRCGVRVMGVKGSRLADD